MGASAVLSRMHDRVLARLGEDAILRGTTPCKVQLLTDTEEIAALISDENVSIGNYGDLAMLRTVGIIKSTYDVKVGDTILIGAKTYTVDAFIDSNGYVSRYFMR